MDSKWLKNGFVYLVITVAILAIIFTLFANEPRENTTVSLTEFMATVQDAALNDQYPSVVVTDNHLVAEIEDRRIPTTKSRLRSASPASSAISSPSSARSSQS